MNSARDADFLQAVRELLAELNAHSGSGMMTRRALVLAGIVERHLAALKRPKDG